MFVTGFAICLHSSWKYSYWTCLSQYTVHSWQFFKTIELATLDALTTLSTRPRLPPWVETISRSEFIILVVGCLAFAWLVASCLVSSFGNRCRYYDPYISHADLGPSRGLCGCLLCPAACCTASRLCWEKKAPVTLASSSDGFVRHKKQPFWAQLSRPVLIRQN